MGAVSENQTVDCLSRITRGGCKGLFIVASPLSGPHISPGNDRHCLGPHIRALVLLTQDALACSGKPAWLAIVLIFLKVPK